jgi:gamma-glutamyl:cysteine ligase YbdK (ATP-grasp superfamily)
MSSTAIATVIKMMESVPETAQDQVVEHLREYLEDLQDELQWDTLFKKTQPQLIAAARRAKKEIAEGLAQPMDYGQL